MAGGQVLFFWCHARGDAMIDIESRVNVANIEQAVEEKQAHCQQQR